MAVLNRILNSNFKFLIKNIQIEVIYRRPDEIDTMVKRGEIWDGQTLASWAMVRYRFDNKEL